MNSLLLLRPSSWGYFLW